MNITEKTNRQLLEEPVERIQRLIREQSFTYGQPAHWSDGVVDVSVDRIWDEENKRVEHLVTVDTGLPFGPALQDVTCIVQQDDTDKIVAKQKLDQRGQVWLENLEPGRYELRFQISQVISPPEGDKPSHVSEVEVQLAVAAEEKKSDQTIQWHESPDGTWRHCLEDVSGKRQLIFEVDPVLGDYPLLRFDFKTDDGHFLGGFVGLYEAEQGKRRGKIWLSSLEPNMDWKNVRRYKLAPPQMQAWGDLKPEDRGNLERCRDASLDDRCANALDEALRRLSEGHGGGINIPFDPEEVGERWISMFCPPISRESLRTLYRDPDMQFRAMAAGEGQIDPQVPSDLYATLLSGDKTVSWKWTTFTPKPSESIQAIDLCEGADLIQEGAVVYDPSSGETRVNIAALPPHEWRLFCLVRGEKGFGNFKDRVLFAVRKVESESSTTILDPARLVLDGYLMAAWRLALEQPDWTQKGRLWLLGNLFARMQMMLRRPLDPAVRLRDPRYAFLLSDIEQIPRERLDTLKQGIWDNCSE